MIDQDTQLGPAMAALNERQRLFVIALFELGPKGNATEAAIRAGYTDNGTNYICVQASRLMASPKVQEAIREEAATQVGAALPYAQRGMMQILRDPAHQDHAKMIKHVQALGGLNPTQKHEVVHKTDAASLRADLMAAIEHLRAVGGHTIDVTPAKVAITDQTDDWRAP